MKPIVGKMIDKKHQLSRKTNCNTVHEHV